MKAVIVNFRMARHHQKGNHMILKVEGITTKEKAASLIGKKVAWKTPGKELKEIKGEVKAAHGNSGAVRVIFETGMPGQAVGQQISIN
ncbi:MAG: 50S ribosomal protein L35ae [Nanoarchaeota archaeon]